VNHNVLHFTTSVRVLINCLQPKCVAYSFYS